MKQKITVILVLALFVTGQAFASAIDRAKEFAGQVGMSFVSESKLVFVDPDNRSHSFIVIVDTVRDKTVKAIEVEYTRKSDVDNLVINYVLAGYKQSVDNSGGVPVLVFKRGRSIVRIVPAGLNLVRVESIIIF